LISQSGPLGGIYTGLKVMINPHGFFIAADMPFLHKNLIKEIINNLNEETICCVPKTEKGIEPLCAIYSKEMITAIEAALNKKELSIKNLLYKYKINLNKINCNYVDLSLDIGLTNINTPVELRTAQKFKFWNKSFT